MEQYRPYYNKKNSEGNYIHTTSRYLQCLDCEKINNAYKVAKRKNNTVRIDEIEEIYNGYTKAGGIVPGMSIMNNRNNIDNLLKQTRERLHKASLSTDYTSFSTYEWLNNDLSNYDPDEMMDFVMGTLKDSLCPIVRIDQITFLPVRDNTNMSIYNDIMNRVYELQT